MVAAEAVDATMCEKCNNDSTRTTAATQPTILSDEGWNEFFGNNYYTSDEEDESPSTMDIDELELLCAIYVSYEASQQCRFTSQ